MLQIHGAKEAARAGVLVMDGLDTTGGYGHQQFIVNSNGDGDVIGLGYQATTNVKSSIIINKAGRGGWSAETYWKDIIKDTIALKQIELINPKLLCFYLGSNDTNYPDSTQFKDLGNIDSATQNGLVGDGVHDSILGGKIAADWIYSEIIKN